MQAFIRRSELTLAAKEVVRVLASYDDGFEIASTAHGSGVTIVLLPPSAISNSPQGPTLAAGWREAHRDRIVRGEAERRIVEAFPDYSQRNALAELVGYLVAHGPAIGGAWPKAAQQRRAEIERAWTYVHAVRRSAKTMLGRDLPADPTADGHWPPRAAAYKSS
jgi:hypothetical protein